MTYNNIKKLLLAGNKNHVVTAEKLDIFLLGNRITEEEYQELMRMLNELESEE